MATTGAKRKGSGRRRRLALMVLAGALLAAVLSVSAATILWVEGQATSSLRSELALSKAMLMVNSYRYYGQSFANGVPATPVRTGIEDHLERRARSFVGAFAASSALGAPLVALNDQLERAMAHEVALAEGGRDRAAARYDEIAVTPLFGELAVLAARDGPLLAAGARAAESDARLGTIVAAAGRAVAIVMVVVAFEAARRRRLRAAVEAKVLRRGRRRFATLVRHATDLMVVVTPDGMVSLEVPTAAGVLGYAPGSLAGRDLAEIVHPDDRLLFRVLCDGGEDGADLRLRGASGADRSFEVRATRLLDDPAIKGIVLNGRDVTDHKRLEEELRHQALHDALTGLANRALFQDRVDHALARRRPGDAVSVVLIDLDDFKSVNDSLGHGAGDELLVEVSRRLVEVARPGDTVARLGGDEFAFLIDDPARAAQPGLVADRVKEALSRPVELAQGTQVVQASVGAALSSGGRTTSEELLRNADVAMYAAKHDGGGRFALFEEAMHASVRERLALKTDLVVALEARDQMELHYQPIVRLASGAPVGVEALVRWRHPVRGLLAPSVFVPLAEETGLVVPLGQWVLEEAAAQLATWRGRHARLSGLTMSVNASARQLRDAGFVGDVRRALLEAGLPPEALVVEITETVLMEESEVVEGRLAELKALGVRLAIDDFGTGFSALGYLKRLPVDLVKVDLTFTSDLVGEGREAAFAEAVVRLGSTLDLETVAEGVEDARQVALLRDLSCEYGQGYLFAEPLPAGACEARLLAREEALQPN